MWQPRPASELYHVWRLVPETECCLMKTIKEQLCFLRSGVASGTVAVRSVRGVRNPLKHWCTHRLMTANSSNNRTGSDYGDQSRTHMSCWLD